MLEIPAKEGRLWIDSLDMRDYSTALILINETAKKAYGITNISTETLESRTSPNRKYKIVGVIGDFQVRHLSQKPFPLVCVFEPEKFYKGRMDGKVYIKFHPANKQKLIAYMTEVHREVMGEGEFEYTFLEDEIHRLYEEDYRNASIYTIFALIALLISCLGLYGISLYDVRQRYREIALRKVHGASLRDLLLLLTKRYAYLIMGSFVVSIPLSYAAIQYYVQDFAYQEPASWWLFAIAALITTGISFATLIGHTLKAASINPAVVMKSE
jgi:ABC-type antimicrobial peptide transport system permease subunit